jgi:hypothetical protein
LLHLGVVPPVAPEFLGRVVAELARNSSRMAFSGTVQVAATLARVYGITDVDGRSPEPLTLERA